MLARFTHEQEIASVLRVLVEEWGPEHITLGVPSAWRHQLDRDHVGAVMLNFDTNDHISIRVNCDEVSYCRDFPVVLAD